MEGPNNFLKKKYDLHNSPEVARAAKRTESITGNKVSQDPLFRIQNYLNRFEEIASRPIESDRDRGLNALKKVLYDKNVIKFEDIPESYIKLQEQILIDRGQGGDWEEMSQESKTHALRQNIEAVIADQRGSLDNWINYFASPDAPYPLWLKYYATRSVLGLAQYDKDSKSFPQRSKGTTKLFPELNREALSYVLNAIENKYTGSEDAISFENDDQKIQFENLLKGENFAKLYAWAVEKVTPVSSDQLLVTEGKWVKYKQGSSHKKLVKSLEGYGTGWCTVGKSVARAQLDGGDFYVYYSNDKKGQSNIPRVAIRMQSGEIAEVRGIGEDQNLDPYIGEVVRTKLKEFPDGKLYEKKSHDMELLTAIDRKMKKGEQLTKEDLVFIYEMEGPIIGFGYKNDPRIARIKEGRNPKTDCAIVLGCQPNEIAWKKKEINSKTKAYVGPVFPNMFKTHKNIEHFYTSFPEGRMSRWNLEIGGVSIEEYKNLVKEKGVNWARYAAHTFTTLPEKQELNLIALRVQDLNLEWPDIGGVYEAAEKLGLKICPPEVGPALRLKYSDQPVGQSVIIAMEPYQMNYEYGTFVFEIAAEPEALWIDGERLDDKIFSSRKFVFQITK